MKTSIRILIVTTLVFLLLALCGATVVHSQSIIINGKLRDAKTDQKISFATITVPNTGIGTVSNSDGEFTLKVNPSLNAEYFEVSHLSYETTKFKISESAGKDKIFTLNTKSIRLDEVSVVPKDPRLLVEMALRNIRKNYSQSPNMMTGFYREYIRQRKDYVSISEAVVDIYKAPYVTQEDDQVKIYKGRKGTNVKKADTLLVQLQGGPNVTMLLDVVKNTDLSIALGNLDNYDFEFGSMVTIDNKLNWVVSFSPAVVLDDPLYFGKIYISQDNMAITRAEFNLDLNDEEKASQMFVQKKPMGLLFLPTSTNYMVTYKEQNGKYYLSYVRIDVKVRCDWKKRLFNNNYTVMSEMAITDRHEDNILKFTNQEVFKSNMVFAEKVQDFSDADFWGEYNIIEPELSIENAIKKFSKSMKK